MPVTLPPPVKPKQPPPMAPSIPQQARANPSSTHPATPSTGVRFSSRSPRPVSNTRLCIYGTGGVGKTTLAAHAPGPVVFIDLDGSLDVLAGRLPDTVAIVDGISSWQELRDCLHQDSWAACATIVVDSITRAETLAVEHTLTTIKREGGTRAVSIEDYGYGKGYQHVYETMLPLFGDLEAHYRAGRNVIVVAHECAATVPNPAGPDFLRWEPRVQSPNSGKASVRNALAEWCDHLAYVGYEVYAEKTDKMKPAKASGTGDRTIYLNAAPHFTAKTRSVVEAPILYEVGGAAFWAAILPKKG